MTRARHGFIAGVAVGLAMATGAVALSAANPASPPPVPTFQRDALVPGAWLVTIPTGRPRGSGAPARVYVRTWEDGSTRVTEIDPDAPPINLRTKENHR